MQGEQGPGSLLVQPGAVQREVPDLLALGVEQERPRARGGHIGPRLGPDTGGGDTGQTWRVERGTETAQGAGSPRLQHGGGAVDGSGLFWGSGLSQGGVVPGSERVPGISRPLCSTHQQ